MRTGTMNIEIEGPVFGLGKVARSAPVETLEVVRTELTQVGDGTEANPYRRLTEYWTLDGDLIASIDPLKETPSAAPE